MDMVLLNVEVEKYSDWYNPRRFFYKDNLKKDNIWRKIGAVIRCICQ